MSKLEDVTSTLCSAAFLIIVFIALPLWLASLSSDSKTTESTPAAQTSAVEDDTTADSSYDSEPVEYDAVNASSYASDDGYNGSCDPNYTPCVPISSTDLDCPDIGFEVEVIGNDIHGFDRDNDGYGCESY